MAHISTQVSLEFKDVNLLAAPATVRSRKEIPIEGDRIIVSAMTAIIGPSFIEEAAALSDELKPTLHIPRDIFIIKNLELLSKLNYPKDKVLVGVGLNTPKLEELAQNLGFKQVFLDVANGYLMQVVEKVADLKTKFDKVAAGSVHTVQGLSALAEAGCDIIRDGIAPGSVCITADSTGYTRGKITEILALEEGKKKFNILQQENESDRRIKTLSDGGLKSPADIVKAFGAGADYVMGGGIFTQVLSCRMHQGDKERAYWEHLTKNTRTFPKNVYFGQASTWGKIAMGKSSSNIEGTIKEIKGPYKSLESTLQTIWDGIRSGISYSGFSSVEEFIGNGVFEIKQSS